MQRFKKLQKRNSGYSCKTAFGPSERLLSRVQVWSGYLWGIVFFITAGAAQAQQVTGGQYAFEFLRLSDAAHVSAVGGISVANPDDDIAFALQNPAMMRPGLHNNLELTYNGYYAGIGIMNLQYGYYVPKLNTSFFFGLQYINYGTFDETDNMGNNYGSVHAIDYSLAIGASRQYLKHWRYGADIKTAHSNYASTIAEAALVDVGINYYDTSSLFDFGIAAKNMGVMTVKYNDALPAEPLPFDLQMGVSKRFKHLPLRLFATIHHFYEWDIRYDNPADLAGTNGFGSSDTVKETGSHFGDKLFRHFILGAELTLAKRLTLTFSYNDLRRKELEISTDPALAGFAFGVGLHLNKFQVHYARSYYHVEGPYNEISLTMALNRLFGLGKAGDHMHWSEDYEDWAPVGKDAE